MLAQLGQHVVEERHTGADLDDADAVQVELDHDLCLAGQPFHPGHSVHVVSTSSRAERNAAISSGVPTVTRSQRGGPTSRTSTPRSSSACQISRREPNSPNSTKLASESATDSPRVLSQATSPSRSALRVSTVASGSGASATAARATACVTADRWYGSRTSRSFSTSSGAAARYPIRAPAMAKALDMVRVTTRRG